jgi:hypothetical protein
MTMETHIRPLPLWICLHSRRWCRSKKCCNPPPAPDRIPNPPNNLLERRLHPVRQYLRIDEVLRNPSAITGDSDPARGTSVLRVPSGSVFVRQTMVGTASTSPVLTPFLFPSEALEGFYT